MSEITEQEQREMIENACAVLGYSVERWDSENEDEDEGGRLRGWLGTAVVLEDDQAEGLFEGSDGELFATVVGGREFHNLTVAYYFQETGLDGATRVEPGSQVELV